jgi:uncharacterized protein (TIGR03067 family)
MRPTTFLLFAALGAMSVVNAGAAPVPTHLLKGANNTELVKLQGRWNLQTVQYGANPVVEAREFAMTIEIRDDAVTTTSKLMTTTGTIKVDKVDGILRLAFINNKAIEVFQQGPTVVANTQYGYSLDGDKLTLATNTVVGTTRTEPADPKKPGNDNTIITVLTRVKETK